MLTVDEVSKAVPARLKNNVTQDLVDSINQITTDPVHAENIRENFISYTNVLTDGKYRITDYMNAVTYASFRMMGYGVQDSYFRTFPDRHAKLIARGASDKDISSYSSAFNKNKLVNQIMEQSMIPIHILNQDAVQKAINAQLRVMATSQSDIAVVQAANSLLTHLAKPKEAAQFQLNISAEATGMSDLTSAITNLAKQQKQLIEAGANAKDIASSSIIEGEFQDV